MAVLTASGRFLGVTLVLIDALSLSMGSLLCALSGPDYLCNTNFRNRRGNDLTSAILANGYASKTFDTLQQTYVNDDEFKRLLRRDRSPDAAGSNIEVAAEWSDIFDGQSGAETRSDGSYPSAFVFPNEDGLNERVEEPRQRRKASRKSNLLDPTYMMMGIGRRR